MKVLAYLLTIHLNAMTKVPKEVFGWEVPVFEDRYGDACHVSEAREVDLGKDETGEERGLPDVREEYERMTSAHGVDPETKQGVVERVFGRGNVGLNELAKHMQAAVVKPKKAEALARSKAKAAAAAEVDAETEDAPTGDPLA
jgi:hypothetical protein